MGIKYNVFGFSQKAAVSLTKEVEEKGKIKVLKLDITDLFILRWFVDFSASPKMRRVIQDNEMYYYVSYSGLLEQCPILPIEKDTLYRRLRKMCELGILKSHVVKQGGVYSYYGFGENYIKLINDDHDESEGFGNKSEGFGNKSEGFGLKSEGFGLKSGTNNSSINNSSINNSLKKENIKERKEKNELQRVRDKIDSLLISDPLKTTILKYMKHRIGSRQPVTTVYLDLMLNQLETLSQGNEQVKIKIIEQAINNGYRELYPLKENNRYNRKDNRLEVRANYDIDEYETATTSDDYFDNLPY